jgi:hypothetical protein
MWKYTAGSVQGSDGNPSANRAVKRRSFYSASQWLLAHIRPRAAGVIQQFFTNKNVSNLKLEYIKTFVINELYPKDMTITPAVGFKKSDKARVASHLSPSAQDAV